METALLDYLEERHHIIPEQGHENALFLSLQNRRMAVRSVENLVSFQSVPFSRSRTTLAARLRRSSSWAA